MINMDVSMKTKMLMISLFVVSLTCLNGCATNKPSYDDGLIYRSGYASQSMNYQAANYNVGYGPDANEIDFNHDGVVGYGGVNVYDFSM